MSKYYLEKQSQKKGEGKEERNRDDGARLDGRGGGSRMCVLKRNCLTRL